MHGISLNDHAIDRRSFLAVGAAVAATLGVGATLYGCDNRIDALEENESTPTGQQTEWKTIACLHGCGTRCMNQVLVKDGIVVRQKTDDTHEDSIEYPQQRGCLRGRALVESQRGADRLKYPLKRIGWTAEDPKRDRRGIDGYERISWDEALDIVAEQLKKTYTEHGPRSVYMPVNLSGNRKHAKPFLDALGGYLTTSDTISYGTFTANTEYLGIAYGGTGMVNDRLDLIENADVVVLLGQNPGWGANGNPGYFFRAAKDRGAKFIYVGPSYNVSAGMLDAHWIPIKPGSDTAFLLGVASEMLRLDDESGDLIDWDFLHRCCVGFDAESMSEGAKDGENFRGYILGEYDGTPKTAQWASAICGAPVEDITYFAQAVGKNNNTILSHGFSAARCNGAEDLPQAYMTIACMGGHFGKPGNASGNYFVDRGGCGGADLVKTGTDGLENIELPTLDPLCDPALIPDPEKSDYVNALEMWDAVIDGKYTNIGRCWSGDFLEPEARTCDIRFIYGSRDAALRSTPNSNRMIEALRKVDFVLVQHIISTPTTPYADIILPVLGDFERDQVVGNGDRDREMFLMYSKLGETPYEARSDQWIAEQLLERLGYNPKDVYPLSEDQACFNTLATTEVMDEAGAYSPLITITQDDLEVLGVEGSSQEGVIGYEELRRKGIYQVERKFGDRYTHIAYTDFVADPEANPLGSESGKFEIFCQAKADMFNRVAFAGETYKPYATYHEFTPEEGFPLLMFNTHYPRSACSDFDNVATLREVWEAPVTLNAADAAALDIASGDPVLVSSPSGKILRTASVSNLIVPGAIDVPNGSWSHFDDEGIDRGGNPNVLYGGKPYGMGVSGYNNVSVKFEKWNGEELLPDKEYQLVIEATE